MQTYREPRHENTSGQALVNGRADTITLLYFEWQDRERAQSGLV